MGGKQGGFLFTLTSFNRGASMKPDFDTALQQHFAAISNRDIEGIQITSHARRHALYNCSKRARIHDTLGND